MDAFFQLNYEIVEEDNVENVVNERHVFTVANVLVETDWYRRYVTSGRRQVLSGKWPYFNFSANFSLIIGR